MSEHFTNLSNRIVKAFREDLGPEAQAAVGDDGFRELSVLIEAHLTDAVMEHLEKVADQVQVLERRIRAEAERYTD